MNTVEIDKITQQNALSADTTATASHQISEEIIHLYEFITNLSNLLNSAKQVSAAAQEDPEYIPQIEQQ